MFADFTACDRSNGLWRTGTQVRYGTWQNKCCRCKTVAACVDEALSYFSPRMLLPIGSGEDFKHLLARERPLLFHQQCSLVSSCYSVLHISSTSVSTHDIDHNLAPTKKMRSLDRWHFGRVLHDLSRWRRTRRLQPHVLWLFKTSMNES